MTFSDDDLPTGWTTVRIDEVGEVQLGRQRSPKHHQGEHMRPYLRVANVFEDRIDTSDVKEMNFTPTEYERYHLVPGDILLNEGQSPELVGRPAMYNGEIDGCCFQNTLVRFRADREVVEPRFALYYFIDSLHAGRFRAIATQTTNIAHLGARRFAELDFPLPPLSEQRRIVDALEAAFADLDAGVAAIEAAQRDLGRYRRSVLKAAVEGALTADWRRRHPDAEPASALLDRVADERRAQWEADQLARYEAKGKTTPKGWRQRYKPPAEPDLADAPELPDGWAWVSVQHTGDVQLGRQRSPKHHQGEHMRPYLRVANVFEDRIDTTDVKEMNFTPAEFERYRIEYGDILLNEGQSPELLGRPAMFRNEVEDACFQNTLVRFRAYPSVERRYALTYFLSCLHMGTFQAIGTQTTNIAHLGARRFAELRFPLPPEAEQAAIVAAVDERLSVADAVAQALAQERARADRLRRAVLQRAFAGALVPQDPAAPPAPKAPSGHWADHDPAVQAVFDFGD